MNLAQLREAVYDRTGVTSADAQLPAPVVNRFVNAAIHQIEVEQEWPWLQASTTISATSGDGDYSVPTDWLKTRQLRIDTYEPFTQMSFAEMDTLWPDASSRGRPYIFAVEVDTILVRPIPDASYTITHRYIKREPDLTADTDSPLMPASFHAAIVELATSLAFRRTREEDRAAVAEAKYEAWRQRMLDDRRRTTGPARIRVRPGSWV